MSVRVYGPALVGADEGKCAGCRDAAAYQNTGYCRKCNYLQQTGEPYRCCMCGRKDDRGLCKPCRKDWERWLTKRTGAIKELPAFVRALQTMVDRDNHREERNRQRIEAGGEGIARVVSRDALPEETPEPTPDYEPGWTTAAIERALLRWSDITAATDDARQITPLLEARWDIERGLNALPLKQRRRAETAMREGCPDRTRRNAAAYVAPPLAAILTGQQSENWFGKSGEKYAILSSSSYRLAKVVA